MDLFRPLAEQFSDFYDPERIDKVPYRSIRGGNSPFQFILFFNVLLTVWGGYCAYRLIDRFWSKKYLAFTVLVLYIGFLPCWCGTSYFYTDSVSISFGVWAAWTLVKNEKQSLPHALLGGCLWGMGYAIKATVAISMVAILMIAFLFRLKYLSFKSAIAMLCGFLAVTTAWGLARRPFPCYAMEQEFAAPLEYWIALGMGGNGGYGENEAFAVECLNLTDYPQRKAYAREYITENFSNFYDIGHIKSKARNLFANGSMGLTNFNNNPVNVFYHFFNANAIYGGYTTMVVTGYFYALWILGMCGQFLDIFQILKKKKTEVPEYYLIQLTVFGLFLFLMIWEAENRQLYNHIPWFSLYAASGLHKLASAIFSKYAG